MPTKTSDEDKVFSKAERDAVAATARERKAAANRSPEEERAEGLKDLQASLAKMPADERAMGERVARLRTVVRPGGDRPTQDGSTWGEER